MHACSTFFQKHVMIGSSEGWKLRELSAPFLHWNSKSRTHPFSPRSSLLFRTWKQVLIMLVHFNSQRFYAQIKIKEPEKQGEEEKLTKKMGGVGKIRRRLKFIFMANSSEDLRKRSLLACLVIGLSPAIWKRGLAKEFATHPVMARLRTTKWPWFSLSILTPFLVFVVGSFFLPNVWLSSRNAEMLEQRMN